MNNRMKHIQVIAFFLIAALALPQLNQIHHVLTVHHHVTHCTAKHEKHFHQASDDCPIHEYVFATTHKIELPIQLSTIVNKIAEQRIAQTKKAKSVVYHKYFLRGPPKSKQNTRFL